ncbi:MAG: peptide-methionine (S)-S-oxide reductase MsrA [Candidatus Diapherotrites archaeon]
MKRAIFAAGCFWGVEDAFMNLDGVVKTRVGYTGGTAEYPTYEQVSKGTTGHAEAVEVKFDPDIISYKELLEVFWKIHNPTTMDRQGPDVGKQYRSAIFYLYETQKEEALKSKEEIGKSGKYEDPIVTEISGAQEFYEAEEYHQKYFQKTGKKSCHI